MAASPTFVYVEDDVQSRRIVEILLKGVMGFSTITTFDSTSAFLEKLDALPALPTVIFLDILVHPHDGYAALEMLRNESRYNGVAVIALTASVNVDDVKRLKKAGFSGLIGKPIIKEVFPKLVEKILAGESVWFVS